MAFAASSLVSGAYNRYADAQHRDPVAFGHAPGAGDAARFMGPSAEAYRVNPYDKQSYTNYAYPEAVKDQQLLIQDTITGLILEDIEWYTTVCLPWLETKQVTFAWNEWNFDGGLVDRVPYEGVSRLITTSKSAHRAHTVRRGLAFIMEADFADTQEGREQWDKNVLSIAQSVQETQDHDTVFALLECKNYQKMWSQRFGKENVSFKDILTDEVETFGSVCLPEGPERLEVLVENYKRLMSKYRVIPNMLILWPGASIYMTMVPSERLEYWKAGPDGPMRRELGPKALGNFRGLSVFETRDFTGHTRNSPPIQLLTRPVQIAEFYEMSFARGDEPCYDYRSKELGTVIYDLNSDQWRKITLLEAFNNVRIFGSSGGYSSDVTRLVEEYNAEGRKPMATNADGSESAGVDGQSEPSFFLTAPDTDGVWAAVRHFGQLEPQHMTELQVQRIGESIAGKLHGKANPTAWADFMHLMQDLQSQGYNHMYWAALIAENTATSVAANGDFIGSLTPSRLAATWGVPQQTQFTQNSHGSLNLPRGEEMREVGIPAGFANWPGMLTLAAEASLPASPWHAIGLRARAAVTMLQNMVDVMGTMLPSSTVIDAANRAPWFHRADPLTTFFDSLLGSMADPLFLAHLPTVAREGGRAGATASASDSSDDNSDLPWFVLPGTLYDVPANKIAQLSSTDIDRVVAAVGASGTVAAPPPELRVVKLVEARPGAGVVMALPGGGTVQVPLTAFTNVIQLTPELRALGLMPAGDTESAKSIRRGYYGTMAQLDAPGRQKLAEFAFLFGTHDRHQMWNVMRGLRTVPTGELSQTVNNIHLAEGASAADIAVAQAGSTSLVEASFAAGSEYSGVTTLHDAWAKVASKTNADPSGAFGFADIAADAQRVIEIQRELLATTTSVARAAARAAFNRNAFAAGPEFAAFGPSELHTELAAKLARVNAILARQAGTALGTAQQHASAFVAANGRVTVLDSPAAIAGAAYYRTPLTTSRALLESLSSLFGGRGFAKPLVVPSDPTTAHTQPFGWHGDDAAAAVLPGSVTRRANFAMLGDAVASTAERPAYATMGELMSGAKLHDLESTPMLQRFRMAAESRVALGENASFEEAVRDTHSTAGGAAFDDSDDEDFSVFNASGAGAFRASAAATISMAMPSTKRARNATMRMGDHLSASSPPGAAIGTLARRALARIATGAFSLRWAKTSEIADPVVRVAARMFLSARADEAKTWRTMIDQDVIIPMNVVVARPNIVFDMASAIMMKGGPETGANYMGGANVAKGADTITKRIHYNFTFRSKALVHNEKNVIIIENLKFEGYRGGLGTKWVKSRNEMDMPDPDRGSLVALAVPMTETAHGRFIDLTGQHRVGNADAGRSGARAWMYNSSGFYDRHVYNFSARATAAAVIGREDFFERKDRITTLALQGVQYLFNRTMGRYSRLVEPQGHLKRDMARPGARGTLTGAAKSFTPYEYGAVQIE